MTTCHLSASGIRIFRRAALLTMLSAALLAGCAGNKKDDDIARLTGERDALREAIARDKAALDAVPDEPEPQVNNRPAPPPLDNGGDFGPGTTTRRDQADLVVEVAGDVLFDSGSIVLKPTAKRTLDQVARRIMSDYSSNTIRVEGYTDTDPLKKQKGKYKDNEELSAERALAVERYLVGRGVASSRVYSAAFGPAKPKGSKKASRRVEIVILNAR
jgi:chemotaxis protein MotB